jgi:uncharacterized protein (TIGR00730 family)
MNIEQFRSICVYCGSADGLAPIYLNAAEEMGRVLANAGIRIIYGAGKTGLMGALADSALAAGGEVIGVVPQNLNSPVLIHANLSRLEVTATIHERKAMMSKLADAFIAMPGGYGTFEELFETLTWVQIGIHRKPVGLLNPGGYFNPLLSLIDHASREGFIFPQHKQLLVDSPGADDLLSKMLHFERPPDLDRWVNR